VTLDGSVLVETGECRDTLPEMYAFPEIVNEDAAPYSRAGIKAKRGISLFHAYPVG